MELALLEDRLGKGDRLALDAAHRVVYAVHGAVDVEAGGSLASISENTAWHGAGPCEIRAHSAARLLALGAALRRHASIRSPPDGAHVEPRGRDAGGRGARACRSRRLSAARHRVHQYPPGPVIRVLLHGRFHVETNGHALELEAGEPWFERGPDPVYAEAIGDGPTSFVRVMVLPAALLGKSSIRYVKSEDHARPKSQTYTVFVDAPVAP